MAIILPWAGKAVLDQHFLDNVKTRMQELADMCTPIGKRSVNTDDAVSLFHHHRMYDKEKLFRFRRVSKVNIYNIGYYEDYFYGYMADHAGYVKYFDLKLYDEGFVLELPTRKNPSVISSFRPEGKNLSGAERISGVGREDGYLLCRRSE